MLLHTTDQKEFTILKIDVSERTNLEGHKPYIDKSFQEGHFTYKFKRSTNHVESL
jgi:hypothetical protein